MEIVLFRLRTILASYPSWFAILMTVLRSSVLSLAFSRILLFTLCNILWYAANLCSDWWLELLRGVGERSVGIKDSFILGVFSGQWSNPGKPFGHSAPL
jgi:hypothetical protein